MKMKDIKTYLVGGAVRDELLGLPVVEKDWVVVGGDVETMTHLGYKQVGKDFPVFLHPKTHDEHALARTERKTARGYHGFEFKADASVTLEDDLMRRDLTVNAIAKDDNGALIDPYHGIDDINNRILRHVSPAFAEDPVRILRIARFAARYKHLGFTIASDTMQLMKAMVESGEVDALVAERVWQELEKTLHEDSPATFFSVLRSCGALAVIFPEIDALFGVPQPAKWHPEIDTGVHTMMVLDEAVKLSKEAEVRFAALTHDLGKATTPADKLPSHHGHEQRGAKIIKRLCERLRVPKRYRDLAVITSNYHTITHRIFDLNANTVVKKLAAIDAHRRPDRFNQFLIACEADARGRTGFEDRAYPQKDHFKHLFNAAQSIDIQSLLKQGFDNKLLAEKIRQARVSAVKDAIKRAENTAH